MSRFMTLAAVVLLSFALVLPASAGPVLPREDGASQSDTVPTPAFHFGESLSFTESDTADCRSSGPATTPKAHPTHSRLEMDWLS